MNFPTVGVALYTALLFARARCGAVSHHGPAFACRILSSSKSDNEIIAERRTPPTTTTSPILHIKSWHSNECSLRPLAFLNVATVNSNRSTNGCGPEALPPNVLSRAPAGLTLLTSHFGISPAQRFARSRRNDFAHPSLESCTAMVCSESNSFSGTSGSWLMYLDSTENPTPVPQSKMNMASSKDLGSSTGRYEQL